MKQELLLDLGGLEDLIIVDNDGHELDSIVFVLCKGPKKVNVIIET